MDQQEIKLRLLIGPAGTGKTARINEEIRNAVLSEQGGRLLIVPEQYSHEAERELCRCCGDTLSLYAEVMSFTGLARTLAAEAGKEELPLLDNGGKLLCMALAVESCSDRLTLLGRKARHPEMLSVLNTAIDSLKASCLSPDQLADVSEKCFGELKSKLSDLACIYEAYQGILSGSWADPSDQLSKLAGLISSCSRIDEDSQIYIDGFTDFTRSELEVIRALLSKGAAVTVCLTLDSIDGSNEIFAIQRTAAQELLSMARELCLGAVCNSVDPDTSSELPIRFLAENIFTCTDKTMDARGAIRLFSAASAAEECRLAAAAVLKLLRKTGARRRDIAIAVRGFDEYAPLLESTFEEYGIPLFTVRKESMSSRPLPLMISCAYDLINGGWMPDDMLSYLGTGLTGLSQEDADLLSAYIFQWDLGSSAWHSRKNWTQHPEGYGIQETEFSRRKLERINTARRIVADPLLRFEETAGICSTAVEQVQALYSFLDELHVPRLLDERAAALEASGNRYEASACRQLWELTVSAIDQAYLILGELPLSGEHFQHLFVHMLSTYTAGIIPVSLDCVAAGDLDRMRRRNIKNLILLGASSDRLPAFSTGSSLFTLAELTDLEELGTVIGESADNEMWREYSLLYNCLSLPSERLILSAPRFDKNGNETRPSFIFGRAEKLFGLSVEDIDPVMLASAAPLPAEMLALSGGGKLGDRISRYFESTFPGRLEELRSAASQTRGNLSPEASARLYGRDPGISASKADKFFSCRYGYFTRYGLQVRPFRKHTFSPSDIGSFTHTILERTAKEVQSAGGFSSVTDDFVEEAARKHINAYIQENLRGFEERTERFRYLFLRYAEDAVKIVTDTAHELRSSRFEPAAFEFDFSRFSSLSIKSGGKEETVRMTGIADRVDTWTSNGKTYLRIADYKTGNKSFSMTDIWYGISMQMLLYLYALCSHSKEAAELLHLEADAVLVPAGVMYVPASQPYLSTESPITDEKLAEKRAQKLRRSGIVLCSDGVPDAWEKDGGTVYTPLKYKNGDPVGDAAVSAEQLELLSNHMKKKLCEMANGVRSGEIPADPLISGSLDACRYCDMKGICGFTDGENGEFIRKPDSKKTEEIWEMIRKELENE